jgi:hypothetical protein
MNRRLIPALLLIGSLSFGQSEKSADEVTARKNALELAGAFTNDGFKLRDGHWSGPIKTGEGKLIQVNLYAGNEYYFSVAGAEKAKKFGLSVYDETGAVITIEEPYQEGATAAVGFSPTASGPYYIKVEELEGEPSAFCLVCSYK